jgi:hypothetical protein
MNKIPTRIEIQESVWADEIQEITRIRICSDWIGRVITGRNPIQGVAGEATEYYNYPNPSLWVYLQRTKELQQELFALKYSKVVKSKTGSLTVSQLKQKLNASVDDDRWSADGRHQAKSANRSVGRLLLPSPSTALSSWQLPPWKHPESASRPLSGF